MDPRLERVAKNESLFRAVNRQIELASKELDEDRHAQVDVLCECGQEGCSAVISLPVSEYERAHVQDDRFILAVGHDTPEIEGVVEEHGPWIVVDKFGEAEELVD